MKSETEFYRDRANKDGLTRTCKVCHGVRRTRYMQSDRGRETARKATAAWRERNPGYRQPYDALKYKARNDLNWAVIRGEIQKPDACQCCGRRVALEGHHHRGYAPAHRLDVVWLCKRCHGFAHRAKAS